MLDFIQEIEQNRLIIRAFDENLARKMDKESFNEYKQETDTKFVYKKEHT